MDFAGADGPVYGNALAGTVAVELQPGVCHFLLRWRLLQGRAHMAAAGGVDVCERPDDQPFLLPATGLFDVRRLHDPELRTTVAVDPGRACDDGPASTWSIDRSRRTGGSRVLCGVQCGVLADGSFLFKDNGGTVAGVHHRQTGIAAHMDVFSQCSCLRRIVYGDDCFRRSVLRSSKEKPAGDC